MPDYCCERCMDEIGEFYAFTFALVALGFICWNCDGALTPISK